MKETKAAGAATEEQTSELKLVDSPNGARPAAATRASSDWLRVASVAAASAVVGGLAAAWFYRKTLSRLRDAGNEIPETRITEDGSAEDF